MPQKDTYQIKLRDQAIKRTFENYLQSGMPRMLAYAHTADDYYLSDERIRKIIQNN